MTTGDALAVLTAGWHTLLTDLTLVIIPSLLLDSAVILFADGETEAQGMSHLPKATKAGNGKAGIPTEVPGYRARALNYPYLACCLSQQYTEICN